MEKKMFLLFTDECGAYNKERTEKQKRSNPFYVRANLLIGLDDYLVLEEEMKKAKKDIGMSEYTEIKWSHYGNLVKNNSNNVPQGLNKDNIISYFKKVLSCVGDGQLYFTLTDNSAVGRVEPSNLMKMHLQNAFQRAQRDAKIMDGYVFAVADDLNDKNRILKKAMYLLTTEGDMFTEYENMNKGLLVDYSDQCCGLQVADICAGAFTASLKYIDANESEKHKFKTGYELYTNYIYKNVRNNNYNLPHFETYAFGIKEVPKDAGKETAKKIARVTDDMLYQNLMAEEQCFMESISKQEWE